MDKAERTAMDERAVEAAAEELRERTAFRYAADCKCGACQLVPRKLIDEILPHLYRLAAYEAAKPAPMSTSGEMVEIWNGDRKVTIYPDIVIRVWGPNLTTEMSDEPRSHESVNAAVAWLFAEQAGELESAESHAQMLLLAVEAGDPKPELAMRVKDLISVLSDIRKATTI